MYTLLRIIGFTFIVLLLLLGLIGFFTSPEIQFSISEIIESPPTVVWQTLINVDRVPEWDPGVAMIRISNAKSLKKDAEIDYYSGGDIDEIIYKERIITFVPDKRIVFRDINHKKIPLQKNFIRDYTLKALLDGSTELSVTVHYTCASYITRILDRIHLRGHTMAKQRRQLYGLKSYIENL